MAVACLECGQVVERPVRGRHASCWNKHSAEVHGMTPEWRRESKRFLSVHRECKGCGDPATTVHHRDGDHSNQDWSNLMALCGDCHGDVEAAKQRRRRQ